ncbi:MAG TPA: amidohydrolase family protein [Casimicrobiaceae bacterium]|jgi:D-galactarolactone isomerase|nr:amidohydrolase family protein [Casimicrobiaceae bacterium]
MTSVPPSVMPALACDCHMHIYEDGYPVRKDWQAPVPRAPVADYREVQRALGLARTIVVQPNAYGFDNRCTENALRALGQDARGIAAIRPDVDDLELARLHAAGFRGARCYLLAGALLAWDDVPRIAARIARFGWHVQLQLDGRDLPRLATAIEALPVEAVIDHNGKFLEPVPPSHPAFRTLLGLLDSGRCWVKLSAPYETSRRGPPRFEDVGALAAALAAANPGRCVWATNWPHPGTASPPREAELRDLFLEWVPAVADRTRILVDNPARLYGF